MPPRGGGARSGLPRAISIAARSCFYEGREHRTAVEVELDVLVAAVRRKAATASSMLCHLASSAHDGLRAWCPARAGAGRASSSLGREPGGPVRAVAEGRDARAAAAAQCDRRAAGGNARPGCVDEPDRAAHDQRPVGIARDLGGSGHRSEERPAAHDPSRWSAKARSTRNSARAPKTTVSPWSGSASARPPARSWAAMTSWIASASTCSSK